MPVPLLDLSRQYAALGEEIHAAITDVCRAGRFILGKEVGEFETSAAAFLHAKHGIGCASGTDALWLALAAAGIGNSTAVSAAHHPAQQLVVTTPFSFFATASSILRAGARPVFADIDPRTFNLSPASLSSTLERHPEIAAVLPVHLFGQCADWDALTALKNKSGFVLIEDAAQAFGALWNGKSAGSLGDAACFSFYPTKNLSAWGDAGLVTTNSDAIADQAGILRAHGMRVRYFHEEVGWNSRLDTVQAAVLLVKLRHIAAWNAQRATLAARYETLFAESGLALAETLDSSDTHLVLPYTDPCATHVWHQYTVRAARRDDLRTHLATHGIGSETFYPLALHQQECLIPLGYNPGDFPESERAAREVVSLPIFPEMTFSEQDQVVEAIRNFYLG